MASCANSDIKQAEVSANIAAPQVTDTVPSRMVSIKGGSFQMGSEDGMFADAQLIHKVTVSGFYMDAYEVTNAEYGRFVQATHYITVADESWIQKIIPVYLRKALCPVQVLFSTQPSCFFK